MKHTTFIIKCTTSTIKWTRSVQFKTAVMINWLHQACTILVKSTSSLTALVAWSKVVACSDDQLTGNRQKEVALIELKHSFHLSVPLGYSSQERAWWGRIVRAALRWHSSAPILWERRLWRDDWRLVPSERLSAEYTCEWSVAGSDRVRPIFPRVCLRLPILDPMLSPEKSPVSQATNVILVPVFLRAKIERNLLQS